MERARAVICRSCLSEEHAEHDLEGCAHIVQRCVREGQESIELCSCRRTPFPLKVYNVLKLKTKDSSH
jgi:hypothetical protein